MKIIVDLSEELFNRVKEVNKTYSLQNFILIALENQIALEKEQNTEFHAVQKTPERTSEQIKEKPSESIKPKQPKTIIEILNNPLNFDKINIVSLKKPIKNYYIWGQYNKFFTLKFALRYLAFMQIKNNNNFVKLADFQNKCAMEASKMKEILNESDEKANRKWGATFSAGLPEANEKSHSRFIHHFIGYADSQGNPVGALSDLGFVVFESEQIALSPFGLEFAKLKNPIIDENPFSTLLFNRDEQEFLINHIKSNIPIEWQGMKNIIEWIESGLDTPDLLNAKIAVLDPKWTEKMANTYRTGMLARMFDLGFISRKKTGVNANYVITDFGKSVVEKT
jgi:hypothetical protein